MGPNARGQLAPRHCVRHRERKASHPTCTTPLPQKKIVIADMDLLHRLIERGHIIQSYSEPTATFGNILHH